MKVKYTNGEYIETKFENDEKCCRKRAKGECIEWEGYCRICPLAGTEPGYVILMRAVY